MKAFKPGSWMLAGVCLMIHVAGYAEPVVWRASRAQAVEAARNSGKLILLLAGRETCPNCQYMKYTVCETPAVRQVLDANYVCWFCPVDNSAEWYAYADGLGTSTLPLMCVIDPGASTQYLDRSTATQSASGFKTRLVSDLPTNHRTITVSRTISSRLCWATENQLRYRVLKSEDMTSWSFVGGLVYGDGSPKEITDSSTAGRCFYRVMGFQ
jgi:hypothetical protein